MFPSTERFSGILTMHENETILRLLMMLRLIPRHPKRIDTATLERKLRDEGFHVTRRTIQRDLLRLARTFPITSDEHRPMGWSWAQDGAVLDLPGMDPSMALTFVLAESFLAPLLPHTTLRRMQPYLRQARKVLDSIPGNDLRGWPTKVRVIHRGPPLQPPDIDNTIQEAVQQGLMEGRRLAVVYHPRSTNKRQRYEVNPLGLVFKGGIAYLVCTLWKYANIKQLALHRIRQVEVLETPAAVPEGFDLDRYIQEGEFRYVEGEPIRLEAIFDRAAAFHLHETPLSADQTITDLDDARVVVQATVQDTAELRWWLLGFGAQVEVVAPAPLRQEFQAMALWMAALYRPLTRIERKRDSGAVLKES